MTDFASSSKLLASLMNSISLRLAYDIWTTFQKTNSDKYKTTLKGVPLSTALVKAIFTYDEWVSGLNWPIHFQFEVLSGGFTVKFDQ